MSAPDGNPQRGTLQHGNGQHGNGQQGMGDEAGIRRARAWVGHLRAGGSTPWAAFDPTDGASDGAGEGHEPTRVPIVGKDLPGAAQLELVRRLNGLAGTAAGSRPELVARVFGASAPGRGQPDLAILGVPVRTPFGPAPVDPAGISSEELVRIASGVLAETAVALDPGAPRRRRRPRRPWRRGLRLAGDPMTVAGVRAGLVRLGHVTGRKDPVAVVLADDMGSMLADTWSTRIQLGNPPAWPGWLEHAERNGALPPKLDLPRVAAALAAQVGTENVHVLAGPEPGAEISRLIGLRKPVPVLRRRLSPDALELVRQVNFVLRVLVRPREHRRILEEVLLPQMAAETGPPRAIPAARRDWVEDQAWRVRAELAEGGYPVIGDLDVLLPRTGDDAPDPSGSGVLDVALRTLLKVKESV